MSNYPALQNCISQFRAIADQLPRIHDGLTMDGKGMPDSGQHDRTHRKANRPPM